MTTYAMVALVLKILAAVLPRGPRGCAHHPAVPVDTVAGERVAWLCPSCDRQLPARWRRPLGA